MLESEFSEYFYYFIISGLIFFLFFFILTIFGLIIFNIITKNILKKSEKLPFTIKIFLSFAIGTSLYIDLSLIPIIFKVFNFYFVYLPLIIIDTCYFLFIIVNKKKNSDEIKIKKIFSNYIAILKNKKRNLISFCFILAILIILQINLQWIVLTKSKCLIGKDPFHFIENIYFILDNDTLNYLDIGEIYPPGFIIFCSGALQLHKDYIMAYYFLKFGGFFFLFLFILNIYQIALKAFKKIYIAFISSILLLSYYLYIAQLNTFIPSSVAIFYLGLSLIIFLLDRKYLFFLGVFIPLIFFFNPFVLLYYFILIFVYFILSMIYFDRNNYIQYIKTILFFIPLWILYFIPYYLYIQYIKFDIPRVLSHLFDTVFKSTSYSSSQGYIKQIYNIFGTITFLGTTPLIENIISFLLSPKLTIGFITVLVFLLFSGIGFLYKHQNEGTKNISRLCRLSIIIIICSFVFVITFLSSNEFFYIFQDRIILIYCPIIIILCGFGTQFVEKMFIKTIKYLKQKGIFKEKNLKDNEIYKKLFTSKKLFLVLLIAPLILVQLAQHELIEDFARYHYDDYTIDSYLFLREKVPENSRILTPKFLMNLISELLQDMVLFISPFNNYTKYEEFEQFVASNQIDYILLDKTTNSPEVLIKVLSTSNYNLLMENSRYYIFSVK